MIQIHSLSRVLLRNIRQITVDTELIARKLNNAWVPLIDEVDATIPDLCKEEETVVINKDLWYRQCDRCQTLDFITISICLLFITVSPLSHFHHLQFELLRRKSFRCSVDQAVPLNIFSSIHEMIARDIPLEIVLHDAEDILLVLLSFCLNVVQLLVGHLLGHCQYGQKESVVICLALHHQLPIGLFTDLRRVFYTFIDSLTRTLIKRHSEEIGYIVIGVSHRRVIGICR